MPFEDDDVVASRTFERDDGEVVLLIHRPRLDPKPGFDVDAWRCEYTIRFPDGELTKRSAVGIDGMQAMLLAIGGASSAMRYIGNGTPEKRSEIRWLEADQLGLTIPFYE